MALKFRNTGSQIPERWLSTTGTVAHFAPEYSHYLDFFATVTTERYYLDFFTEIVIRRRLSDSIAAICNRALPVRFFRPNRNQALPSRLFRCKLQPGATIANASILIQVPFFDLLHTPPVPADLIGAFSSLNSSAVL